MSKPMNLLLVEDDPVEHEQFMNTVALKYRNNVSFIEMTGSSDNGIKLVKKYMPDGIILDLELHKGQGSGLEFLKGIKGAVPKPIIFVTTNTPSNLVYNLVRDMGVDFIYYKRQKGYSPEMVISNILDLWRAVGGEDNRPLYTEQKEKNDDFIQNRINEELDLIGVSIRHKGREYIAEAIQILLDNEQNSKTVFYQVADIANITYSSVIRAIQTAINNTWQSTEIGYLYEHYTAHIDVRTGVPAPTEFVRYYADKIRKEL